MAGTGGVNMEQFEAFFQRADLDRDGRISGAEAVGFFQGSNLSKQVLAQIWTYADQNRIGYLSRPEFYNALKLVTVAQSKRDLTPDIVRAALVGPASARIPAPQINLAAISPQQPNTAGAAPPLPAGAQNYGVRGQASNSVMNMQLTQAQPPNTGVNQQYGQIQPSSSGTGQQFGQLQPSAMGLNQQLGQRQPSNMGLNQQFGEVRPTGSGLNQQFGQVRPSSIGLNQQVGQVRPSSGLNHQFGLVQQSNAGFSQHLGQAPSSANIIQQSVPSQAYQQVRPPPTVTAPRPHQNAAGTNFPTGGNMVGSGLSNSSDLFGGRSSGPSTGTTQVLNRGPAPNPQDILAAFSSTAAKDPKGLGGSGNRPPLDPMFGGDMFSANQASARQVPYAAQHPPGGNPTSSAIVPVTFTSQPSLKPDPFEALRSTLSTPSTGAQTARPAYPPTYQQGPSQIAPTGLSSGVPAGPGNSTPEQPEVAWPKMTQASIQKYAKVFMEVDVDRDRKISGEEARKLFTSWRLPREVLKQVWDLSDQDNDSMLSLREFCIALYLMERYREGRPLPSMLPNSVMLDGTLLSLAGPPPGYVGGSSTPGVNPQQILPGATPTTHAGLRPPMVGGSVQINQQTSRDLATDISHANQFSNGVDNSLDMNGLETTKNNEKVENNENVLLDSREKLEFYRTKMQDLVLYKSRCDNRLNEITERARADKGEAESLEQKYQEKYKQVAEIHSKLTIEEASFREVQERKMELHQAIVKMEQGGSADGILQVRADRVQSDLEDLLKTLTERCKKHDVQLKSPAIIELPQGWQPGIPDLAAIWDEDWDKFEDEGFSFDVVAPADPLSVQKESPSPTRDFSPGSVSNGHEKPFEANAFGTESMYSADELKSPQRSPGREKSNESPTGQYSDNHFRKSSDGDAETNRSFEEPSWSNFDNNDDVDSIWGTTKESDHGKDEEKYFFGSNDYNASPKSNASPQADSFFHQKSPFTTDGFEDSVSGSPLSRASNSPPRNTTNSNDSWFDSFSGGFDSSFRVQDSGSSPKQNLSRFDSISSSTGGFDHSRGYSFDDTDPFGSSGPFKVPSDTTKKGF